MRERAVADGPIRLHTVVHYWGQRALIVGRAKPVNSAWQYDLLLSRDGRLVVVPRLPVEAFSPDLADLPIDALSVGRPTRGSIQLI
ncbi:MAG: hypothetical protein EXQ93_00810 [Alphaproteobacteria bacterium]|nr:hypothetical protein [Alphaproteobacteria bacterium]